MIKIHFRAAVLPIMTLVFGVEALAHPFDDLTATEIRTAIQVVRQSGAFAEDVRFPVVRRLDPPKVEWLAKQEPNGRRAYLAIFDFKKSLMTEAVVDLVAKKIISTRDLVGLNPPVLIEEYERARQLIRADERWKKAMAERGVKDLKDVWIDVWAPGLVRKDEMKRGQRLLRGLSYFKGGAKNFYSRPIEGVVFTVDLSRKKVVSMWDLERTPVRGVVEEMTGQMAGPPLKPLETVQKEGESFVAKGQDVSWFNWRLRWSMDPLKGLQLYHIRYLDNGKERSIIYKLSLAEMLVPYGSPEKTWSFRNAFDVGEYGLGKTAHPLVKGRDVPQNTILYDVALADDLGGAPQIIPAVGVYERDGGLLWKHRDAETGDTGAARGRELVLTFMTTIGNYDYGVNYIFALDGTIRVEVQLTGILLAKGSTDAKNSCRESCRLLVEPFFSAPPHQHFFNFRIDFDIDGADRNRAVEMDVVAFAKGKSNPDGNAFGPVIHELKSEKSAMRDHNWNAARKWKVMNVGTPNGLGHPTGYALMAGETAVPYLSPSSPIRQRARFIEHPIWFTVYKDDEMSAAAEYPTTAPAGEGLPKYVANNESLADRDVVMWYTFGVTHVPRPEEWPIMNVHRSGFTLMPVNFFSRNPVKAP